MPTSSLVFERCLESFRKTRVERAHGVETEVTAQVKGQGGSLHRERTDHEEAEYDDMPDDLMSDAIVECRRQEQQQRSLELERAWTAADQADDRARLALDEAHDAQRALRRAEAEQRRYEETALLLQEELDGARAQQQEVELELGELRALIVERHPCTAQDWDRCGEQALEAKRQGDYARAHSIYAEACGGGSADACGNWGVMFEHGLGIAVDVLEARRLYDDACEADSAHACANLGALFEHGRGTDREPRRAAKYYDRACDGGQMQGCARLGQLLAAGTIRPDGWPPAGELLERACAGDFPRACLWKGARDLEGLEGERRATRAAESFARGCERDVFEACVQLGRLHELGDGVEEDSTLAAKFYRRACEGGESRGCAAVERLSRLGEQSYEPIELSARS